MTLFPEFPNLPVMAPARGVPINGSAVRAIREARGINSSTLATEVAISTGFLSNIEAGRKIRVSPEVRQRIADRLQCGVDAIAFVAPAEVVSSFPASGTQSPRTTHCCTAAANADGAPVNAAKTRTEQAAS